MINSVAESGYPIDFRKDDAKTLGQHLKSRHSVVLVGMKRVGISNFLRFFIYHPEIIKTYINDGQNYLLISIDFNDLVEREIYPFWVLAFKRIVDAAERAGFDQKLVKELQNLFLDTIQSKELFLLIDGIRKSLIKIVNLGVSPTLFFIRFDRIHEVVTTEFFANLEGLRDATNQKMSYVFTSYRNLDKLIPQALTSISLSIFSNKLYLKPASLSDLKTVFQAYKFRPVIAEGLHKVLFELVGGHIQYLQLSLISLHENRTIIKTKTELFNYLSFDERILSQSEELWESLDNIEKNVLLKVTRKAKLTAQDKNDGKYLFDTGFIEDEKNQPKIFSPIFESFLKQKSVDTELENSSQDFSKKEFLLFSYLKDNLNQVCERETIIENVWTEEGELGVSDWAIDRLISRVRNKLKQQNSEFEILTIKTRGFKLVAKSTP